MGRSKRKEEVSSEDSASSSSEEEVKVSKKRSKNTKKRRRDESSSSSSSSTSSSSSSAEERTKKKKKNKGKHKSKDVEANRDEFNIGSKNPNESRPEVDTQRRKEVGGHRNAEPDRKRPSGDGHSKWDSPSLQRERHRDNSPKQHRREGQERSRERNRDGRTEEFDRNGGRFDRRDNNRNRNDEGRPSHRDRPSLDRSGRDGDRRNERQANEREWDRGKRDDQRGDQRRSSPPRQRERFDDRRPPGPQRGGQERFNERDDRDRRDNGRDNRNFKRPGNHDDGGEDQFEWGGGRKGEKSNQEAGEEEPPKEKEKPNFGLSGKLTEETNTVNGVVIKYAEPPEARKPKRRWRLYPFKGQQALPTLHIHRQSCFLIGRDRKICDIPVDHPSCSKQHAALQYRLVNYEREDGMVGKRIRPYVIDLESANGTFVNNQKIDSKKYVELLEKDVVKFGFSSREYVLLHENSQEEEQDDNVVEEDVKVKEEKE